MFKTIRSWFAKSAQDGSSSNAGCEQARRDASDPRETDPRFRNGYAPFPEALVISTERSGLNLVRHAVESAGHRRTPGQTHLLEQGPLAFHRTHWVNTGRISPGRTRLLDQQGKALYSKVMLLLRDPFEIYPRSYNQDLDRMNDYCDNLSAYHQFDGEKLLIYYDDLVSDDSVFKRIFLFLGLDVDVEQLDVPMIRSTSVTWYQKTQAKGGGSQTKGSPAALKQHQQQLTDTQRAELLAFLNLKLGDCLPTYCGRWLA